MSGLHPQGSQVAPSPRSASTDTVNDGPLRLDTTMYNGREVTVVRNAEGNIVYPSQVPPATTSPVTSPSPNRSQPPPPKQQQPPSPDPHPRKSVTSPIKSTTKESRPGASVSGKQRSVTEGGMSSKTRERRSFTLPNMIKRAGTNISALQHNEGFTSSSDSSSDEGDDSQDQGQAARKHHRRHHKHKRFATEEQYRRFHIDNEHYRTRGKVSKRDGRLSISLKDTSNTGYLAKVLGIAASKVVPLKKEGRDAEDETPEWPPYPTACVSSASTAAGPDTISCPKLNIVIMVIGSRGDAQPFLKVGKILKEQYGHRVRIATHPAFREFVEKDSGLEFFSVGGDPSELMSFMVKNPGMIPTLETVKAGDIGRRRAAMAEMFGGFWRACINATDDEKDVRNIKMMGEKDPFVADAIIANPPSFAHIHCAEALGIPLHLMFTFPYTPTQAFPHPLASIKKSNVDPGYTNWISYPLVEMMVWQGLGDLVNDFRVKTLGLDPVSTLWAPGATYRLHVPFTYLWSPGLVPKPQDWGEEIDVSGFVFLDLASTFKPPSPLTKFLDAGEAPIYIGFGSIVVDDADRFTKMIFEAVKLAGVRALVSKGWGGLGGDALDVPENIFLLDNTPHDWLFPKVRACVIHGGAGTTAIALKCGKPTMIVPFFGDQHFWGSMLSNAGGGPEAVPYKDLTAEKLAEGIKYCLTDEAREGAEKIAKDIELEGDGAENACKAFHKHLALEGTNSMRCSILEDRVAVWQLKNINLRLSSMAAEFIVDKGYVSWKKLRLLRHNEWNDFEGPGEPVTGVAGSLVGSVGNVFKGIGGVPVRIARGKRERRERKEKRWKRHAKKKQEKEKGKQNEGGDSGADEDANKEKASSPPWPATTEAIDHAESHEAKPQDKDKKEEPGADDEPGEEQPSPTTHVRTTTSNAIMERRDTQFTVSTADPDNPAEEFITQVGHGAYKSAAALARAPVDLSLALAQGFHNAPRLYGDDTVRRPTRVTGIRSGLRAARHEFVYGIYDGWTGLVRLPVRGAKDGGVRGFVTGVGMGLTGFVLKDIAALIGPVGYTLKGVVKQVERGGQPIKYIRRARIVQGEREVGALSAGEKRKRMEEVSRGWDIMRELWAALDAEEKKKRKGWRGRLHLTQRKERVKRGLGAAFESVETAERALTALERGERVETVVGKDKGRERASEDKGKSSPASAKEAEKKKGMDGASKRRSFDATKEKKKRLSVDTGVNGNRRVVHGNGSDNDGTDTGPSDLSEEGDIDDETPPEEENPFSPTLKDMERNKAENKKTMETMERVNGVVINGKA